MEEKCGGYRSSRHRVGPEKVMLKFHKNINEAKGRELMKSLMERCVSDSQVQRAYQFTTILQNE